MDEVKWWLWRVRKLIINAPHTADLMYAQCVPDYHEGLAWLWMWVQELFCTTYSLPFLFHFDLINDVVQYFYSFGFMFDCFLLCTPFDPWSRKNAQLLPTLAKGYKLGYASPSRDINHCYIMRHVMFRGRNIFHDLCAFYRINIYIEADCV